MFSTLAFVAVLATAVTAAPGTLSGHPGLVGQVDNALLQAELQAWKAAGKPDSVHFLDNKAQPVLATIVGNHSAHGLRGALGWGWLPSADDIKFHLFTQQDESDIHGQVAELSADSFQDAGFDPKLPTKVVIHGFGNNIESPAIQDIKNAYLGTGPHNVIGVDWSALCPGPLYLASRVYVGTAGDRVGDMLKVLVQGGLVDVDKLHLLGHSLGAHVAGLAAKKLFKATGKRPSRVTGLDPAWPLFFVTPASGRLDKGDADLVDVIHTCAGDLGFVWALGTVDFYPNGGNHQPGCAFDVTGSCSHGMSVKYFAETVTTGNTYQGFYCKTDLNAADGKCTDQPDACMGDKVSFKEPGSFYVNTDDKGLTTVCQLPEEEKAK